MAGAGLLHAGKGYTGNERKHENIMKGRKNNEQL